MHVNVVFWSSLHARLSIGERENAIVMCVRVSVCPTVCVCVCVCVKKSASRAVVGKLLFLVRLQKNQLI